VPALDDWPGELRRNPPPSSPTYAVRAPLAAWLLREARARTGPLRVLDVGCGVKPYYPFFADQATEYVGVDVVENPAADLQGAVESLPVEDASFDVVLCIQVLEHADDPVRAVRELRRVAAPGGRVLASTHGVQVYHPAPVDLWRWTHAGLDRLFRDNASWSAVTVTPASGTTACLGMLVSIYVDLLSRRAKAPAVGRAVVGGINRAAAAIDRRSDDLREPRTGSLIANFHVVAEP
jgi:SAM-dependent methyltransferase